jgi:hypothetical protein
MKDNEILGYIVPKDGGMLKVMMSRQDCEIELRADLIRCARHVTKEEKDAEDTIPIDKVLAGDLRCWYCDKERN